MVAGWEVIGKASDWLKVLKWDPVECGVESEGTKKEERDLLMALQSWKGL